MSPTGRPDHVTVSARAASHVPDDSGGLTWLPAWRLRELIVTRQVTSVEVVEHFLRRIDELDPELRAFRTIDARGARKQAARADDAVTSGDALGLLHGVPIAVKELFSVTGFPDPGADYSSYLEDREADVPRATRDDIEVQRLRAAGAIILGTTIAGLGPTSGMTDPTGLPRNPWNTAHTPGGSSSGNGPAVAGGLVPLAIGDDGAGSIRLPSAFCGLVGLSPSRGLVPHIDYLRAAARPTVGVGPMARDARDAAVVLQVLAGPDGRDLVCLQDEPPDYLADLDTGIRGMRLLWTDDFGFSTIPAEVRSPAVVARASAAAHALARLGATVSMSTTTWDDPLQSLRVASQLTAGPSGSDGGLSHADLVAGLASRERNWRTFRDVFAEHDIVVSPTVLFTAPAIDDWIELCRSADLDDRFWYSYPVLTMMCNVLGLPAISIPAGLVNGLPVGMQIIGRPGSEGDLLRVARSVLEETGGSFSRR